MLRLASTVLLVIAAACGGHQPDVLTIDEPMAVSPEPTDVRVQLRAERVGESVSIWVEGHGMGTAPGAEFEDPKKWRIRAKSGDEELRRLVNGPLRIAREPVLVASGLKRWNTTVTFHVVYRVSPDADKIRVWVTPPRAEPFKKTLPLDG